ncbi:MAG TPA: serine hydrolase domain-containing protein [Trebonia sp.]
MELNGYVAPGFGQVAEEFSRNFTVRGDLGASFAVMRDDEALVDLWGGIADRARARPWTADTLQILFSGTKGFVAACLLLLIERGQLTLEAPVARYWPEFAAAGKAEVPVRDLVTHAVGLPGLEVPVTWQEATDARRMAVLLAAQPRSRDPRATRTYHAVTFGWLCGELVRRIDGRGIGQFFAEEIALPLDLELWIGLPAELEARVSTVELAPTWTSVADERLALDPLRRAIGNPPRYQPESFPWNEPDWHAAEVPSSNGIGTARSVARFYACLEQLLSPATVRLGSTVLSSRHDPLMERTTSFGVGFQLQTDMLTLGPEPGAFGHGGAGGSVHGRWPRQRLGFSYAMNQLRDDPGDTRAAALLTALYGCVEREAAA